MLDIPSLINTIFGDISLIINYILGSYPLTILVFTICGSLILEILGRLFFKVSPILQPLQELEHKQENNRRESMMRVTNRKLADYYIEIGDSFLDVSQLEAAKDAYEKAFTLDPMSDKAHMGIIKSEIFQPLLKTEPSYYDMERTIKKLKIIIKETKKEKHTVDKQAIYFLGELYRHFNLRKAEYCFKRVISLKPKSDLDSLAYYGLAWIALTKNDKVEALELAEKAEKGCKWNPVVLNGLAYVHIVRGEYEDGIEILKPLLASNPYILASYLNIIMAYIMTGKIGDAYIYSKKLIYCIEYEDVFSLVINRRLNVVEADNNGGIIFLRGVAERKCFSYFYVALSCYLYGSVKEARIYINKALSIDFCDKTSSLKVLHYRIKLLQKKDDEFTHKLGNFTKMIEELDYYNKHDACYDYSYN